MNPKTITQKRNIDQVAGFQNMSAERKIKIASDMYELAKKLNPAYFSPKHEPRKTPHVRGGDAR